MRNLRPGVVLPRFDAVIYDQMHKMPHEHGHLPTWNREQLIRQFRGIDGSSRSEAEMQVDALERGLRDVFPVPPPVKNR